MRVWRKQTIRWQVKGVSVPPGAPKAKRVVIESKRFYGTLTLANGKRKQQPLTQDRDTSETLLRRLQTEQDSRRANGADRYCDERLRPIGELLTEYGDYLTSKGNTPLHVATSLSRCRSLIAATKVKTIGDLEGGRILKTLSEWRQRKAKSLSIETSNHYLVAVKSFSRWLFTQRRSPDDPLAGLKRMNADTDRRKVRRPLTPVELALLTDVAQISKRTFRGDDWQLTPADRTMLYLVAAYTGLRAQECASLTKASFDLEAGTFTVEAKSAKNRRRTTLPLHPALADRLRIWFATIKRESLFGGSWAIRRRAGMFLHRDMAKAGIANADANGTTLDFHSLRYTFITGLAKAGVHPAKAQRLARHSTIALTMGVYTQLDVDDLRDAVSSLPALEGGPPRTHDGLQKRGAVTIAFRRSQPQSKAGGIWHRILRICRRVDRGPLA
jgi:integrase